MGVGWAGVPVDPIQALGRPVAMASGGRKSALRPHRDDVAARKRALLGGGLTLSVRGKSTFELGRVTETPERSGAIFHYPWKDRQPS